MRRLVISELATPTEVALELRVSTATVKRWLRSGELEGVKLPGGAWRVRLAELDRLRTRRAISGDRPADRPADLRPGGFK